MVRRVTAYEVEATGELFRDELTARRAEAWAAATAALERLFSGGDLTLDAQMRAVFRELLDTAEAIEQPAEPPDER